MEGKVVAAAAAQSKTWRAVDLAGQSRHLLPSLFMSTVQKRPAAHKGISNRTSTMRIMHASELTSKLPTRTRAPALRTAPPVAAATICLLRPATNHLGLFKGPYIGQY